MKRPFDARTVCGLVLTATWLCIAVSLAYWKREKLDTMELNAIGDFLAGVFAPLGFLWLVIGYFQQGEELQQNTEALKQQAEELKNSVAEQKALVKEQQALAEATRRHVELVETEQRKRLKAERRAVQPIFRFTGWSSEHLEGRQFLISTTVANIGHSISKVKIECSHPANFKGPVMSPIFDNGGQISFAFVATQGEGLNGRLDFAYLDGAEAEQESSLYFRISAPEFIPDFRPEHVAEARKA